MTIAAPVVPRGGRIVAVLGIVLVALSMRTAVGAIAPIFEIISDDLHLDIIVLSFIGAAPPIGFAIAGVAVPAITRRWGLEPALLAAIVVIGVGQAVRAFSAEPLLLMGSTAIVMLGIGATNVLLPPLVRRYFPDRIGGATSLYLVLMGIGASFPAFTVVQIAEASDWRWALGLWAFIPVLAVVPWLSMLRTPRAPVPVVVEFDDGVGTAEPTPPGVRRRIAHSPTAWAITAGLAMTSATMFVATAFLPAILTSAGVAPLTAAIALGIAMSLGIPEALIVPLLATRAGTITPMLAVAGACGVVGWGGMLLAPTAAPLLWAVFIGLVAIVFPISLLLVNGRTRNHTVTVSVSGFVQGIAYVTVGVFSFGMGLLHDATGSWTVPLILLLATMALTVPTIVILGRGRFVDDELAAQPGSRHERVAG